MVQTRRLIVGLAGHRFRVPASGVLAFAALAAASVAAAALPAPALLAPASVPAAAGPCTVAPVLAADVALGARASATTGLATVPVGFTVSGHCTAAQLRGTRWTGSSGDTLAVVEFGYTPGATLAQVSLDDPQPALITVSPEPLPVGVHAATTTFRIRNGAWLSYVPIPTPVNVYVLRAQQWTLNQGWGPMGGRVLVQKFGAGHWLTLRSATIDHRGQATVYAPERGTIRFLVPGTTNREPAALER